MDRKIEDYGNKLQISGMLLSNGEEADLILLPETDQPHDVNILQPSVEELQKIFYQLDVLEITNSKKVVLRKSQRQVDQNISWNVFRRDNYTCVYCGNNHTPLTVDHVMTWEEEGDTVEGNLVSACRKCNKTRGNKDIPTFLESDYYKNLNVEKGAWTAPKIMAFYKEALKLPKRKPRSR